MPLAPSSGSRYLGCEDADALVLRLGLDGLSNGADDLALTWPHSDPAPDRMAARFTSTAYWRRLPAKSSIPRNCINQNPFFPAPVRPYRNGPRGDLHKTGHDDFHGEIQTHDGRDLFNARNPITPVKLLRGSASVSKVK